MKRDVVRRMCRRKARFRDEWVAMERAAKLGMRSYACPICSGYHLTKRQ